jgi:hypothetical protein
MQGKPSFSLFATEFCFSATNVVSVFVLQLICFEVAQETALALVLTHGHSLAAGDPFESRSGELTLVGSCGCLAALQKRPWWKLSVLAKAIASKPYSLLFASDRTGCCCSSCYCKYFLYCHEGSSVQVCMVDMSSSCLPNNGMSSKRRT